MSNNSQIILFDGVCNMCNDFVQFVIKHDKSNLFQFYSLQSEKAKELISENGNIKLDLTTLILLDKDNIYTESDAILQIVHNLGGGLQIIDIFRTIPNFIRNGIYHFVSRHRYQLFGQKNSCMIK